MIGIFLAEKLANSADSNFERKYWPRDYEFFVGLEFQMKN